MSKLALQLIAENKRTRTTFLDLGNCGLTRVPDEIGELVWLESLTLSSEWLEWTGTGWKHRTSRNSAESNKALSNLSALRELTNLKG